MRGGKKISLKAIADEAVAGCPGVRSVFVFKRTGAAVAMLPQRDSYMDELLLQARPYCPCEPVDRCARSLTAL